MKTSGHQRSAKPKSKGWHALTSAESTAGASRPPHQYSAALPSASKLHGDNSGEFPSLDGTHRPPRASQGGAGSTSQQWPLAGGHDSRGAGERGSRTHKSTRPSSISRTVQGRSIRPASAKQWTAPGAAVQALADDCSTAQLRLKFDDLMGHADAKSTQVTQVANCTFIGPTLHHPSMLVIPIAPMVFAHRLLRCRLSAFAASDLNE